MFSIYLRTTWIPLLVFIIATIATPVFVVILERRQGRSVRPWHFLGYLALGAVAGALLAGQMVMPPKMDKYFEFPPPGIR
jgi:drug/metabolite transporter (DMT)-like permease